MIDKKSCDSTAQLFNPVVANSAFIVFKEYIYTVFSSALSIITKTVN